MQDLTQKLNTLDAGWNQRTTDMQKKVNTAAVQLDDKQRTIIMQWFMYGGGVAGVGLLLGLLLAPYHSSPQKRQPLDELSRAHEIRLHSMDSTDKGNTGFARSEL